MTTKKITATGEMSQQDLEIGGDFYHTAQELKAVCDDAGVKCTVKPFDVYQGPYAEFKLKSKLHTMWHAGDDEGTAFTILEGGTAGKPVFTGDGGEAADWLRDQSKNHLSLVKSSLRSKVAAAYTIVAEEEQEEEEEVPDDEPQEDDIILTSTGNLGSQTSLSAGGKHLGNFTDQDKVQKAIVDWINKNKWHPNMWEISDHGNAHPYTLDEQYQKMLK